MTEQQPKGMCFVIAPIGERDSETRKRSDMVLNYIIRPAVEACGFDAVRADESSEPGIITHQVIQHIVEDPMLVADLTDRNPNVYYELAIRHTLRKPYVQIIQNGQNPAFDVINVRTIPVDHLNVRIADEAKREIVAQIKKLGEPGRGVTSPVSYIAEIGALQSGGPEQKSLAELLEAVSSVALHLSQLERRLGDPTSLLPAQYLQAAVGPVLNRIPQDWVQAAILRDVSQNLAGLKAAVQRLDNKGYTDPEIGHMQEYLRTVQEVVDALIADAARGT